MPRDFSGGGGGGSGGGRDFSSGRSSSARAAAPAAAVKKPPSILGQLGNTVQALPSGLVHFLGGGVKDAARITRTIGGGGDARVPDLPKGQVLDFQPGGHVVVAQQGAPSSRGTGLLGEAKNVARDFVGAREGQSIREAASKNLPITAGAVESVGRTAGDVVHPSRFAKAAHNGEIVSKVLEDLANVSLGAGGVAKLLNPRVLAAARAAETAGEAETYAAQVANAARRGVASEEAATAAAREAASLRAAADAAAGSPGVRLGRGAASVARFGEQGAGLPAKPYQLAAQGVGRVLGKAGEAASTSERLAPLVEALGNRVERTRQNLEMRGAVRDEYAKSQGELNRRANTIRDISHPVEKALSRDEQVAVRLLGEEDVTPRGGLATAVRTLPDDEALQAFLDKTFEGRGDVPTAKAARLAVEAAQGSTDEAAQRVASALEATRPLRTQRATEELAGVGRTDAGMNPEQMGNRPLSAPVQEAGNRFSKRVRLGEKEVKRAQRLVTKAYKRADAEGTLAKALDETPLQESKLRRLVRDEARTARAEKAQVASELERGLSGGHGTVTVPSGPDSPNWDAWQQIVQDGFGGDQRKAMAFRYRASATGEARPLFRKARPGEASDLDVWLDEHARRTGTEAVGQTNTAVEHASRLLKTVRGLRQELRGRAVDDLDAEVAQRGEALRKAMAPHADESMRDYLTRGVEFLRGERAKGRTVADSDFAELLDPPELRALEEVGAGSAASWEQVIAGMAGDAKVIRNLPADLRARLQAIGGNPLVEFAAKGKQRPDALAMSVGELKFRSGELRRVLSKREQAIAKAEADMRNAPARYRPAIATNQAASKVLAEMADKVPDSAVVKAAAAEIPRTLKELVDAGVDPEHFIGGTFDHEAGVPTGLRGRFSERKLSSQKRRSVGAAERDVRSQAGKEYERARDVVSNLSAEHLFTRYGKRADDLGIAGKGKELVSAAKEQGYVPWNIKSPFGKVADEQVTTNTVFVPAQIDRMYRYYFRKGGLLADIPGAQPVATVLFDMPHRVFRTSVLALSPAWHIGNVLGNTLMATIGGGVDPITLAKLMPKAWKAYKEGSLPPELQGAGMSAENLSYFRPGGREPRTPFGKLVRGSYKANGVVDDMTHNLVYMAKKGQGYTDAQAVREALKVAGDFSRMSPFERDVVRRAVPFYAWMRHVHQLAAHLALEHPARVAWTLHLADLYGDPQEGLPDYAKGGFALGGGNVLRFGSLNPYQDVGSALSIPSLLRSTSPTIKTVAGIGGLNLNRAVSDNKAKAYKFTAPPGFEGSSPSLVRQVTKNFLRQGPLAEAILRDVRHKPRAVQYDTGQPIISRGKPIIDSDMGAPAQLLRLLGFPTTMQVNGPEEQARKAKAEASKAKQRRNYDLRRKAAGL